LEEEEELEDSLQTFLPDFDFHVPSLHSIASATFLSKMEIQGQSIQVNEVQTTYRKHTKSTHKFTCLGTNLDKKVAEAIECNDGTWKSKSGKKVCKESSNSSSSSNFHSDSHSNSSSCTFQPLDNTQYPGHDINDGAEDRTDSAEQCFQKCNENPDCLCWTWNKGKKNCWLKSWQNPTPKSNSHKVSGLACRVMSSSKHNA
jgi:hypothetical protein